MIEAYEAGSAPDFELYALGLEHKHVPELQKFAKLTRRPIFVPSVGNFRQGMLVSVPLHLDDLPGKPKARDLAAALAKHFAGAKLIKVVPATDASFKDGRLDALALNDTDGLELRVFGNETHRQAVLVARLDNLGKGASGAAGAEHRPDAGRGNLSRARCGMSRLNFDAQRLFVEDDLGAGAVLACTPEHTNYLRNVLRLKPGDTILLFNGRDGEWLADLTAGSKRAASLAVVQRVRSQAAGPDVDYLFAPLKRQRLDYVVQKATEMGVARLRPVLTRRTIVERVNTERLRANVIEAAEQCGILRVPQVDDPDTLERVIAAWQPPRTLIFCDEDSEGGDPVAALARLAPGPLAVLIGPEGGFDARERELVSSQPFVARISLGPRILRADTAGVAILALVNATLGDWR